MIPLRAVFFIFQVSIIVADVETRVISVRVFEETLPNEHICDLSANVSDMFPIHSQDTHSTVSYQILGVSKYFYVESSTGKIYLRTIIDREAVCKNHVVCVLSLPVLVTTNQQFIILKVNVEVIDIDDNYPQFPLPLLEVAVDEGEQINLSYTLPMAVDGDSLEHSDILYEIISVNDTVTTFDFTLLKPSINQLKLLIVGSLDAEYAKSYIFVINALAAPTGTVYSTLKVRLVLRDVNDNSPRFDTPTYTFDVKENAPLNYHVGHVRAADSDISYDNSQVRYTITKNHSSFAIDQITGEISVVGTINYELTPTYSLHVIASDTGHPVRTASAIIKINILDINDHAPEVELINANSRGHFMIAENSLNGSFVGHLVVKDQDHTSPNNKYNCHIDATPSFVLRQAFDGEYVLTSNRVFDRESMNVNIIDVRVICEDYGYPVQRSLTVIKVEIYDINDNSPRFINTHHVYNVSEGVDIGSIIGRIKARDLDIGRNSLVTHELAATLDKKLLPFTIGRLSGTLKTNSSIDFETTSHFKFFVLAKDGGYPQLTSMAEVLVRVTNVNDNLPVFRQQMYIFTVQEEQSAITSPVIVGKVNAVDADCTEAQLSYFIEPNSTFQIDRETGVISTWQTLDREVMWRYEVIVKAMDSDVNSLFSAVGVEIIILDINDNKPSFTTAANKSVIYVTNQSKPGQTIANFEADDPDFVDSGELRYILKEGPDFIAMNEINGDLHLIKPVSGKLTTYYNLTVAVTDSSGHIDLLQAVIATKLIDHHFSTVITTTLVTAGTAIILILVSVFIVYKVTMKYKHEDNEVSREEAIKNTTSYNGLGATQQLFITTKDNSLNMSIAMDSGCGSLESSVSKHSVFHPVCSTNKLDLSSLRLPETHGSHNSIDVFNTDDVYCCEKCHATLGVVRLHCGADKEFHVNMETTV